MRVPKYTELTPEQRKLYLEVPLHGHVLVSGPPGTGKTVIALLRAAEATRSGRAVTVGMFNQTLRAYVQGSDAEFELPHVDTVDRLFRRTWYSLKPPPRENEATIVLSVPYSEKDHAKGLGARFTTNLYVPGTRGVWTIDGPTYRKSPEKFARWHPHRELPMSEENKRQIDWEQLSLGFLSCEADDANPISWDHLVIDEGQDFPPQFYRALRYMTEVYGMGKAVEKRPTVTVLADENQRLTSGANSTIGDIARELRITPERHFRLEQNFRNTIQIAKVASAFYCGAPSGIPALPARSRSVPELHRFTSREAACEFIRNYALAPPNANQQIGVLVGDDNRSRQAYHDTLARMMPRRAVHTYDSSAGKAGADGIPFDQRGVVLVLNRSSCKGLEFDAVFIVDLQAVRVDQAAADFFKMGMYVMCSRARTSLFLSWVGLPGQEPEALRFLPDASLLIRKAG